MTDVFWHGEVDNSVLLTSAGYYSLRLKSGGETATLYTFRADRMKLEGLDPPKQMGSPGFGGGEGGAPESEDLRALVDAFETFLGFRDSFNGRNPELLGARSVESHANALPAIFDAKRGAGGAAAEAEVLRATRRLKKTIVLCGVAAPLATGVSRPGSLARVCSWTEGTAPDGLVAISRRRA